jgi:hypothetical protein
MTVSVGITLPDTVNRGWNMALMDTFVRQVKFSGKSAGDKYTDGGGMYLHVTGVDKYWRVAYRHADKQKTLPWVCTRRYPSPRPANNWPVRA